MTLSDIEKIHKNNLDILLLNSAPLTTDIQHAIVFALECIEEKERGFEKPHPKDQDAATWNCYIEGQRQHAARAERERVLDYLDMWFHNHDCRKSEHGNYWTPVPFPASELMRFVESLRKGAP